MTKLAFLDEPSVQAAIRRTVDAAPPLTDEAISILAATKCPATRQRPALRRAG